MFKLMSLDFFVVMHHSNRIALTTISIEDHRVKFILVYMSCVNIYIDVTIYGSKHTHSQYNNYLVKDLARRKI